MAGPGAKVQGHLIANRYLLLAELGSGGMGTVWHGRDELLNRDVAVKEVRLPPGLGDEERETLCRRTMREARTGARLSHPNVVVVYDVVEEEGRPWIVMELVRSRSLAQVVNSGGPLEPKRVAEIGVQLLAALGVAHAAGIAHRDVKPSNVLLRDDEHDGGHVVLTDFGIATLAGDSSLTKSGIIMGAPPYIAPERALGRSAGPESDLWSLGATLFTAVEGHPPHDRGDAMATLTAVVTEEPEPPRLAGPLWPVLKSLLAKDPSERIEAAHAEQLLRWVARGLEPQPQAQTAPHDTARGPSRGDREPVLRPEEGRTAAAPARTVRTAVRKRLLPTIRKKLGGRLSGRAPLVLGTALAVLAGGTILGWGALRSDEGQPMAQPRDTTAEPADAPAAGPGASMSPAAPAAPESPPPPPGFSRFHHETGFSVAIPDGWRVERRGHVVYFRDPDNSRFLLVDQTNQPKDDPVADWERQEQSRRPTYPDYQRVRIERVQHFLKAADWEFTYSGRNGRLHVLNRGVVTGDKQAYGIYWSTLDSRWAESLPHLKVFMDTFQPAGAGERVGGTGPGHDGPERAP